MQYQWQDNRKGAFYNDVVSLTTQHEKLILQGQDRTTRRHILQGRSISDNTKGIFYSGVVSARRQHERHIYNEVASVTRQYERRILQWCSISDKTHKRRNLQWCSINDNTTRKAHFTVVQYQWQNNTKGTLYNDVVSVTRHRQRTADRWTRRSESTSV